MAKPSVTYKLLLLQTCGNLRVNFELMLYECIFESCRLMLTCIGALLIDFSLTVKAVTLIFISGRGLLFHLLNKGNQVLFIIW